MLHADDLTVTLELTFDQIPKGCHGNFSKLTSETAPIRRRLDGNGTRASRSTHGD